MLFINEDNILLISEKYVEKLFGVNKDRMSMDQMAVLLVSNINESKGHSEYLCLCLSLFFSRAHTRTDLVVSL